MEMTNNFCNAKYSLQSFTLQTKSTILVQYIRRLLYSLLKLQGSVVHSLFYNLSAGLRYPSFNTTGPRALSKKHIHFSNKLFHKNGYTNDDTGSVYCTVITLITQGKRQSENNIHSNIIGW